jgi:gamma-butyrobetaine dioxygenase
MTFLRHLRDSGFVIVRGGPRDVGSGETMAAVLGEITESTYGRLFDLNPSSNNVTFGNTMNTVPPHTDEAYLHSPPGVNVLHCLRPADEAGESVLVDGFYLAEQLRLHNPQHFDVLTTVPQPYHRIVPDLGIYHIIRGTVIKLDSDGDVAGFRYHTRTAAPLDVSVEDMMRVHAANAELSRIMLDERNQACFILQAGEAV